MCLGEDIVSTSRESLEKFIRELHELTTHVKTSADGYQIRSGIVVIVARAFPQLIEEGKLFMVEPPLFSFEHNGMKMFVSTNREYATYLQNQFVKKNTLYRNGTKVSDDALLDFLERNERYLEYLKNVSDNNICSMPFTELIIANINKIGLGKKTVDAWDKLVKKNFSPQLNAAWIDDGVTISGIKDGRWEKIEIDEDFINSKKTKKLLELMSQNLNIVYGYEIHGKEELINLSIGDVLNVFDKYQAKGITRYKGLGEMSAKDLQFTCMDLERQRAIRVTTKDVDKAIERLAMWHSRKPQHVAARGAFMSTYVPDIKEIST